MSRCRSVQRFCLICENERNDVMNIGKIAETSAMTAATAPKTTAQAAEKKDSTLAADNTDKFVKSDVAFTPAYTKATVTNNNSNAISDGEETAKSTGKKNTNGKTEETAPENKTAKTDNIYVGKNTKQLKNQLLQDMVSKLISGQATSKSNSFFLEDELKKILSENSFEQTEEDADYWSADSVATRIYDFARSLAGDDSSMFDTLKNAFEKGFGEAEGLFNSSKKLPDVCYETYDKVMEMFDEWEAEINGTATEKDDAETAEVEA